MNRTLGLLWLFLICLLALYSFFQRAWSMQESKPLQQLKGHKRSVICLDYAKKSFVGAELLASGSGKQSGNEPCFDWVWLACLTSEDQTCRIWDARTFKAVKAFAKQGAAISSVRFASKPGVPQFYMAVGSKVWCKKHSIGMKIQTDYYSLSAAWHRSWCLICGTQIWF